MSLGGKAWRRLSLMVTGHLSVVFTENSLFGELSSFCLPTFELFMFFIHDFTQITIVSKQKRSSFIHIS